MGIKKEAINFVVRVLINKRIIAGAPAIIINKKGGILLGKRSNDLPFYPSMWGLPGGIIEYNESPEDAIKRELKEEMGVLVKVKKPGKPCMHFPDKNCPIQILDVPFYCKIQKGEPKAKDETSEVKWFKPKEIKNMKLAYEHKKILKQEGII